MADVTLSTIAGSNGVFIAESISGQVVISSGATGTIATITPAAGKRISLDLLTVSTTTTLTSLTTLVVGSKTVITGKLLFNNAGGTTGVANILNIGGQSPSHPPIRGEIDEVFTLTTNVSTSGTIFYAYSEGV